MPVQTCRVPMRDGTELATDIYLPDGQGPWPVLLARTPYDKGQMVRVGRSLMELGYAFAVQDCRGTGGSGGRFGFYPPEVPDAQDFGTWLVQQPWCDGQLAIFGLSYLAGAALAIATEMHERVKGCIWVTLPIGGELLSWQGGALRLHHALPWSILIEGRKTADYTWPDLYQTLPIASAMPEDSLWRTLTDQESPVAPFWKANDLLGHLDRVRAPGLHFGGWYDFLADATLIPYQRMCQASGAAQYLMMGPWSHNTILSGITGV